MSRQLIRASAGSGKTFQLSGHFLKQLFHGHRPETILATTFTRKAAGEILGRVLTRLAQAADDDQASRELSGFLDSARVTRQSALQLLVQVTRELHRLRVCTLDSFFQLVARSLTLELGLQPGWSIVDEHVDAELRQQAIDAVLSQHVSRDAQQLMQMLAKGRSKRSVRDLIDETVTEYYELYLLTEQSAWQQFPRRRRLTQEECERALQDLQACDLPADKRADTARGDDIARFRTQQWDAFVSKGLAGKVASGEHLYYGKPLSAELVDVYERLVSHARAELIEQLAQQTKAVWELMSRYDAEYSRLRAEHGWMRFSDVTRVLAQADTAADGQRMHFRLDSTIRHLLLDEFQDTSPDQWRILKRLALSLAERREETSFLCVGDGKQAIYGWRGGESAILDAVQATVPDIEATPLHHSRRSAPAVIEAVNQVFRQIVQHGNLDDYHAACAAWSDEFPAHSTASDRAGYVELRTSPSMPGESAEERRGPWHRWVAEQIRELHQQCPGAEIGVLARRNSTVARLVHELTLLQVPASEEGGTPPVDSPAVLAVMSLLHLTSHPGCRISRFHVALSPLGPVVGLTAWDDELLAAEVAVQLRGRLLDDGYGRTLQWLSESVREACSQRDLLRLQQVVAAGWQFDRNASLNAADFVRLLENSRFSKSEPAPVRVMTIHQSKGLEFDIVVVPELDGQLVQTPSAAVGRAAPGESPDRVCVWRSKSVRSLLPPALQQAFEQTTSGDLAEALCLLYVALTRAKHSLHMWIPPVSAKKPPKTCAGLLVAALTSDQAAPEDRRLYETGDPHWYRQVPGMEVTRDCGADAVAARWAVPQIRLAPLTNGRRRGLLRRAPSRHDATQLYLPAPAPSPAALAARERPEVDPLTRGTLFHKWFEQIEWLEPAARPDPRRLRDSAAELALSETVINTLLPDFYAVLEQPQVRAALTLTTGTHTSAFRGLTAARRRAVVWRVQAERPFVLLRDGAIVQGTIDRLVLAERQGRVVAADILDFKTDRCVGQRAAWVREKMAYYAPQLAEYRAAVAHCFRLPAECISSRLVLLEVDEVIEVTSDDTAKDVL